MSDYKYRICRGCGLKWNVSCNIRSEKKYVCPHCTRKNQVHILTAETAASEELAAVCRMWSTGTDDGRPGYQIMKHNKYTI